LYNGGGKDRDRVGVLIKEEVGIVVREKKEVKGKSHTM